MRERPTPNAVHNQRIFASSSRDRMSIDRVARSALLLCFTGLLGACAAMAGAPADDASYGISVAAQVRVPGTQEEVAACLRRNENSASYPQGVSPGYTATET